MLIELEDEKTWPNDIKNLLSNNIKVINKEIKRNNKLIKTVECYSAPSPLILYPRIMNQLMDIMSMHEIMAYHCTRLLNWEEVRNKGLRILTDNYFIDYVVPILSEYIKRDDFVEIAKREYKDFKNIWHIDNRVNMIWFVFNKSSTDDKGCARLFKYFGGEITRRVLYKHGDEFGPTLSQIGLPTVVKCRIRFDDVQFKGKAMYIIESMINYWIKKYIEHESYEWGCEGYIREDILPNDILDIYKKDKYADVSYL